MTPRELALTLELDMARERIARLEAFVRQFAQSAHEPECRAVDGEPCICPVGPARKLLPEEFK